jgi:hypothetical protein
MADPLSKSLKRNLRGEVPSQAWDDALDGGEGDYRALTVADLGGSGPLAGPSSNITRTLVPTGPATAVEAGPCTYGFTLENDSDSAGDIYYGAADVSPTKGRKLQAGDSVWLPYSNSSAVYVLASAPGTYYRGMRD